MNDLAGHLAIAAGACAFMTLIVMGIVQFTRPVVDQLVGSGVVSFRRRLTLALNILRGRPTAYNFVFEQGKLVVQGDGAIITHCVFTGTGIELAPAPDVPESRSAPAVEKWLET